MVNMAELKLHHAYLGRLVDEGLGYRAMVSRIRKDKGFVAPKKTMENMHTRLIKARAILTVKLPMLDMAGLKRHHVYLGKLVAEGLGYKAMATRIRKDKGLEVPKKTIENMRNRLVKANAMRKVKREPFLSATELRQYRSYLKELHEAGTGYRAMATRLYKEKGVRAPWWTIQALQREFRNAAGQAIGQKELSKYTDYLTKLVKAGVGYRAMTTRLRGDKGILASANAMKHVRQRLVERDAKAIGGAGLVKYADYLRTLVDAKLGYRAMTTRLYKDHGVRASLPAMQEFCGTVAQPDAEATNYVSADAQAAPHAIRRGVADQQLVDYVQKQGGWRGVRRTIQSKGRRISHMTARHIVRCLKQGKTIADKVKRATVARRWAVGVKAYAERPKTFKELLDQFLFWRTSPRHDCYTHDEWLQLFHPGADSVVTFQCWTAILGKYVDLVPKLFDILRQRKNSTRDLRRIYDYFRRLR